MSKTLILAFVFTIIWKLSCGIGLNCTFGSVSVVTIGSVYQCNANSITIDVENKESITAVSGTHQSGRTNENVQALWILSKGMEYFPVNIAQFFPNIKAIYFGNNLISDINNQHLFPLPGLVFLNIRENRITSLPSNLFSGLSMRMVSFDSNNIKYVGNEFILPNTSPTDGYFNFLNNPCISRQASTPGDITALRKSLLENCPPNWLTNVTDQTQSLVNRTDGVEQSHSEMDGKVKSLTNSVSVLENRNLQLTSEVTELQQINLELTNDVTNVQESNVNLTNDVTNLQRSNVELTNEVTGLTNEVINLQKDNFELTMKVADLQEDNLKLTNEMTDMQSKNSQLETRMGFLYTRAGYLEERVAVLESLIENKLRLNIDEVISENVN